MTRPVRIHTSRPLELDQTVELETRPARHLVKVLRRRAGDPVVLFNGDGREYSGTIAESRPPGHCSVTVTRAESPAVESPLAITLVQAIGRGERMDWTIQKACELGVAAIIPVFTERTEVKLDARRAEKRLAHWHGVAVAACEQSGRVHIPHIGTPLQLTALKPEVSPRFYLDPTADCTIPAMAAPTAGRAMLAIGPEGGFADHEIEWLKRRDFEGLRLGPRVLRTETAGPAAIAILQALFGDLQ
ncbi:16S rRNA (uracil(1498)-N(3))-methyltransferase [Wenzhouxiangella sp. AB-CW3]|uniref:16S rRNA (uracil(1498)-N(3))-methyltransferase n=1 Tax=Wenzhouxiangella sp. AB-CW3 TaxID=2771012 RepID=UPI00168AF6CF|nr:16S rRNA (uracil(1498)-N(3))-methyltransferase [Wenzhouxiangella sp. AB-CW3]QOC23134.1 16S rRNA (uracil(1498)-N(3))-methyltransferase [Wenzhouxiangella sp. AB-CW3]